MADIAERRIAGAVLTPALVQLIGGLLLLTAYLVVFAGGGLPTGRSAASPAETWLAASKAAFDDGRYTEALPPTLELTRAFPKQHVYWERLALVYQHLGQAQDEAAAWERMVTVSPNPVDACPALPDAYARASKSSATALHAYRRCAAFDTENADMLFYLGRALDRAGDGKGAEAAYRKAVAVNGGHADSLLGVARLDLRGGRIREADEAARRVLEADPDHADALLIAGLTAQRSGRGADARRFFDRALVLAEGYADVHIALGTLDLQDARLPDARRHFLRAIEIDPANRAVVAAWLDRTTEG